MTAYAQAPGDTLVPGAASVSELGTTVGGFIASCGWAAYAALQHVVEGTPANDAEDTALTQQAVTEHQTVGKFAGSGQATPQDIKYVAAQHGVHFLDLTQAEAFQVAGQTPVEIGVANAAAFGGADSNVAGHYITALGKTAKGDIVASDPNQPESQQGKLNVYTQAQIQRAQPFWFGAPASGSGSNAVAPSGTGIAPQSASLSIPGVGNLWTSVTSVITNPISDVGTAISNAVGGFFSAAMVTLKRMGVFVFGLLAIALGLIVLFRAPIAQGVRERALLGA